ncbi:hypothetical protein QBZ16_003660 [Prototheca wickerhamii]|uniref:Histidinol dehydrogenase, chloroplastic n=1 Tax=Prototheca wickerhamii TaxID=3111 RepID=A0AAD9IKE5_PROWI|nr:hypothetical protein QBZ16_003660 [Prototheca wickerhamii]
MGIVGNPTDTGMQIHDARELDAEALRRVLARPRIDFSSVLSTVAPIVEDVRKRGDAAVRELTQRFDGVQLDRVCVPLAELETPALAPEVQRAFDTAHANIAAFHAAQRGANLDLETMPGVRCRRVTRAIPSVGLYVPGGSAVLPSSALMLAIPAALAGCGTIVLATPPRADGSVSPEVLYCAKRAGATHLLLAGGAQAVAAMAWGTASVPKVDKLLGPGNQFVTAAKMALQSSEAMVAIDMPAGPSEVMVVADAGAAPAHVALDLLSQAEHGPDSQAVLIALPGLDAARVRGRGRAPALRLANAYAPEHLILNVADADDWVDGVQCAGSVFVGPWTPESVGDYASGTNHTLPTYGYARMYSGVSLDSFTRKMTVQRLSREGLERLGPAVMTMAAVEGLEAHRRAVAVRLGVE